MKSVFASKTFWVNVLAAGGMVLQGMTGSTVGVEPATQATVLALVNIFLRTITKDPVTWGTPGA
jgi:hypothetical protein